MTRAEDHGPERRRGQVTGVWRFFRGLVADAVRAVAGWGPKRWLTVLGGLLVVAAAMVFLTHVDIAQLREWAVHTGPWFAVLFVLLYTVLTLFPLPRTVWTVAAGILFGPWLGFSLALLALSASAVIAFSGVRFLLGDWMAPRLRHPAVAQINHYLRQRGWVAIASLRMIGPVPFSIVNYAAALAPIPLSHFAWATTLGSIPTTAIGVFFGDTLTGQADPWVIAALVLLSFGALALLIIDARQHRFDHADNHLSR